MAVSRIVELLSNFDSKGLLDAVKARKFTKSQRDQNILQDINQLKTLLELCDEDIHHLRLKRIVGGIEEYPEVVLQSLLLQDQSIVKQCEQIKEKDKQHNLFQKLAAQLGNPLLAYMFEANITVPIQRVADEFNNKKAEKSDDQAILAAAKQALPAPNNNITIAAESLGANESNIAARLELQKDGVAIIDARRDLAAFVAEQLQNAIPALVSYIKDVARNPQNNLIDMLSVELARDVKYLRDEAAEALTQNKTEKAQSKNVIADTMQKVSDAFTVILQNNTAIAEVVKLNNHLLDLQKSLNANADNYQVQVAQAKEAVLQAKQIREIQALEASLKQDLSLAAAFEDGLREVAKECQAQKDIFAREIEEQVRHNNIHDYESYLMDKTPLTTDGTQPSVADRILARVENDKSGHVLRHFSSATKEAIENYKKVDAIQKTSLDDSRSLATRFVATRGAFAQLVSTTAENSTLARFINKVKAIFTRIFGSKAEKAALAFKSSAQCKLEETGMFKQLASGKKRTGEESPAPGTPEGTPNRRLVI